MLKMWCIVLSNVYSWSKCIPVLLAVSHATCFLKPLKGLNIKISSTYWYMHTTCFDQHWSFSGVSKFADETTVLLPSVSSILGVFPHLWPHVFATQICILTKHALK
jgi:hypothetical protein